jgi:pimeloyl-ACP methyl ester carboxylesterase
MPVSHEAILAIQADCMADDIEIIDSMTEWSEEQVIAYFESGGEEKPDSGAAPAPPSAGSDEGVSQLLSETGLSALGEALAGATLQGLTTTLHERGRASLMDDLKARGVARPPDRQKLAKAIAALARGSGLPIMACFFSGGMTEAQGHDMLKLWLREAAEKVDLRDQVVLPHIGEAGVTDGSLIWDDYVRRCEELIYAPQGHKGRPVVIVAHSHGCVGAYALARRLGTRVLKLCVVCRRPPQAGLLDEVLGIASGAEISSIAPHTLISTFHKAWASPALEQLSKAEVLPPAGLTLVETIRRQYAHTPGASGDAHLVVGKDLAKAKIPVPIYALAASQESPLGETLAKMQGWHELSSVGCEVVEVDASHMGTMRFGHGGTFEKLVAQIKPIVDPIIQAEDVRKKLEQMGK